MSKNIEELLQDVSAWENALNEDGYFDDDHRVPIKEAFSSPDAPILFPKVISRTLKEAAEPELLVTPLLSVVRLGKGRSMEFPAVNTIEAAEIAEGQEYPEQKLAFAKQVEGKVSKKGVKVAFTEEVVADSQWDIVGMHVRACGRALGRKKEQIALSRFAAAATVVFDNTSGTATTGLGSDGTANSSLVWDDVIDMAAVLLAEKHVPTDFILHPLMWAVFAKNAAMYGGDSIPKGSWGMNVDGPSQVANATAPLGLNVIVSPFVSFTAAVGATPAHSDVFLIDRNEVGVLLVRDDLSIDEWDDMSRDIRSVKMKERYDIVMLGDGEGITVAKDVDLVRSYDVQLTQAVS